MLKPESCKPCNLYRISTSFTKPEGKGRSGVIIIGEAAGYEEGIDGLPFRPKAQAGSKLEECIKSEEFTRDDFLIYNICACQPPNNHLVDRWYTQGAIKECSKYRDPLIRNFIPPPGKQKVILALGNTAFQTLTGLSHSVLDVRGYPFESRLPYGPNGEKINVVPSLHPSFIKRGHADLTPLLSEDIRKSVRLAAGSYVSSSEYKRKARYTIVGHDAAEQFYISLRDRHQKAVLSYDIETAESGLVPEDQRQDLSTNIDVTQIQFAIDKYNAIIFPNLKGKYYEIAKKILALPNIKAGHFVWNFDNPILRSKGIEINEEKVHDTLWMAKHWQPSLPRGLQAVACFAGFPFAWKHLFGSDLETYGGADVCSIHFILEWLPKLMKERGIWNGYINHVYHLHPILHWASVDGEPVNEEERQKLKVNLVARRDKLDKELQEEIPDEIKNIKPRRKITVIDDSKQGLPEVEIYDYGYLRQPKEVEQGEQEWAKVSRKLAEQGKKCISLDGFLRKKYGLSKREFDSFNKKTGQPEKVQRWCVVEDFKASKEQLSKYILWKKAELEKSVDREERKLAKLYEVPVDHEGNETTRKGEIEILFEKTGDIVLQRNLEIRSLSTNINNYLPNWKPDAKGFVHPQVGFLAASGQLDARQPNSLNISKWTSVGQLFRRIIEAPEGWIFLELDKRSFHVATLGYCANDKDYIRFSQLDPHSIFTSFIMPSSWGLPIVDFGMSDEEMLDICKKIKKKSKEEKEKVGDRGIDIRQQVAKPCVLGNQLELGPRKLYWNNRRSIESIAHAKRLQEIIADRFPKVEQYKDYIKRYAAKKTYLINEFGYIQHYFDVLNYRWNKKANGGIGEWQEYEGQEARHPIAFRVQGCAFGMIKEELFRILKRLEGKIDYRPFKKTIHDSLVFMIREKDKDTVLSVALDEMNRPCSQLVNEATGPDGLRVGVEWSIGRNLQQYHPITNVEGMRDG